MTPSQHNQVLGDTIQALVAEPELLTLGTEIGKIYTNHGLPIDMALTKLDMTKQQKLAVLTGALNWLIQHRRNSDATEKAIERQRKANKEILERFIKTGETGVY